MKVLEILKSVRHPFFRRKEAISGLHKPGRLIVTTSFSVFELDPDNGTLKRLHSGNGLYYGIAQSHDRIYIAARNRYVSSPLPQENESGEILVLNYSFEYVESIHAPFVLRDMHEIAWFDGRLWVTCSFNNFIGIWDGRDWEQWYPLQEDRILETDVRHYNSLHFEQDQMTLLANNKGDSEVLCFSFPERRLLERKPFGRLSHNIWKEDGEMFVCSSGEGIIQGSNGSRREIGGFPRGYARDDTGNRYVGINETTERAKRDFTDSHIAVFDQNWKRLETLELKDEGMILDIRRVENPSSEQPKKR